ncbi:MAG: glutamate--tRNA ligase [Rhodospirillales bacterium]|jgi:glutamyl-tRNA synthetase|nr:glutamate--tRNA ligase [Rhodospirillales bacterium]
MTVLARFAPSPTGLLHVGNARMALVNWLFAERHGGKMILRLDDTDQERSQAEFAEAIDRDLDWLGLDWAQRLRQSDRLGLYQKAFARLRADGRIYACYETPEELEYKRRRQRARGLPPIYDRAALTMSDAERRALEAKGRKPHWRFLLLHDEVTWDDLVRGPQSFHGDHLSDPVLVRADGTFLYMLPSTVDDTDLAITHVIRGEDHVANTAIQIQLFQALGTTPPVFAHLPLLADISGKGLSKRLGSLTVASLREAGIEPMALNAYLATLGTSDAPAPGVSLKTLAEDFELPRYGRGTPKFDLDQLHRFNERMVQHMPYAAVAHRLCRMGLARADAGFWEAIRPNIKRLDEAAVWHRVCFETIDPVVAERDFAERAAALLPPEPWDECTWECWTRTLKEETGRGGRALFRPLRLALTGAEHGPELKALLPLIGRQTAARRLLGEAA